MQEMSEGMFMMIGMFVIAGGVALMVFVEWLDGRQYKKREMVKRVCRANCPFDNVQNSLNKKGVFSWMHNSRRFR